MIYRLVILVLLIWLGFKIYRTYQAKLSISRETVTTDTGTQNMVTCETCKVHIPEKDAFTHEGRVYCSRNHVLD